MDLFLVVMVHGLHGLPSDFDYFEDRLRMKFNEEHVLGSRLRHLLVLKSAHNSFLKTHHGLQVMRERLASEILLFLQDQVTRLLKDTTFKDLKLYLSIVGHSLGGLIARSVLPLVLNDSNYSVIREAILNSSTDKQMDLNLDIIPVSYMSVCTPHLGSRRPTQGRSLYQKVKNNAVSVYLRYIIGSTGRELGLTDAEAALAEQQAEEVDEEQSCMRSGLLMAMSDFSGPYVEALMQFPFRTLVGHRQDVTVPLCSSTIRSFCPYSSEQDSTTNRFRLLGYSGFKENEFKFYFSQLDNGDESITNEESLVGTQHHSGEAFLPSSGLNLSASPSFPLQSWFTGAGESPKEPLAVCSASNKKPEGPEETEKSPNAETALELDRLAPTSSNNKVALLDLAQDLYSDNTADVEFSRRMLCNLQKIGWRRLSLDYGVRNPLLQLFIHAIVIGKRFPFIPSSLQELSECSTNLLVQVLLMDFQLAQQ